MRQLDVDRPSALAHTRHPQSRERLTDESNSDRFHAASRRMPGAGCRNPLRGCLRRCGATAPGGHAGDGSGRHDRAGPGARLSVRPADHDGLPDRATEHRVGCARPEHHQDLLRVVTRPRRGNRTLVSGSAPARRAVLDDQWPEAATGSAVNNADRTAPSPFIVLSQIATLAMPAVRSCNNRRWPVSSTGPRHSRDGSGPSFPPHPLGRISRCTQRERHFRTLLLFRTIFSLRSRLKAACPPIPHA